MKENAYIQLLSFILPPEMSTFFDLVSVSEEKLIGESNAMLHLHLDEKDLAPEGCEGLKPNGFYETMLINDFPIRDKKVMLHVRRRRWIDAQGKSVSRDWDLVAQGTRLSKEFAAFLKEYLGYDPSNGQEPGETL